MTDGLGNHFPKKVVVRRVRDMLSSAQVRHHVSFLVTLEVFHGDTAVHNGLVSLVRIYPTQLGMRREGQTSSNFKISVPPLGLPCSLSGAPGEP
eukprot:816311-Amphidinium_carterae.1